MIWVLGFVASTQPTQVSFFICDYPNLILEPIDADIMSGKLTTIPVGRVEGRETERQPLTKIWTKLDRLSTGKGSNEISQTGSPYQL